MAYTTLTTRAGTQMPRSTATNGTAKSVYGFELDVPFGSTVTTTTGGFRQIFQTNVAYPNRIESLQNITLKNVGVTALEVEILIDSWTDGTPDTNISSPTVRILRYLLPVGEHIYLPNLRLLDFSAVTSAAEAYLLNNKAPSDINSGALFQVSGFTLGAALDDTDTTVTVNTASHSFVVGDLIQVGTDTTTVTRQEIMRVTSIASDVLTVERALYGTSKADKDSQTDATEGAVSGARIHYPFFNINSNSNHYGGLSTCRTDSNGRLHVKNFMGYGRYGNSVAGGINPGSIAGKFYDAGWQSLGLSGVTSSTSSGLAVSTEYGFDLTCDGSGLLDSDALKFTTDSSTVAWGGTNGIISKIQAVFDEQYYTTSSTLLNEKVTIAIVGGDIRFTSGQRLSTSAILLAAPSAGETTPFGVGRVPAIGSVKAPVAARLPDDIIIDNVTGISAKNTASVFYDDGLSNISGSATGTINYETGELNITGPPRADFVFTASYGSAMSGGTKTGTATTRNSIHEMSARSLNHKIDGKIEFTAYE